MEILSREKREMLATMMAEGKAIAVNAIGGVAVRANAKRMIDRQKAAHGFNPR